MVFDAFESHKDLSQYHRKCLHKGKDISRKYSDTPLIF